MNGDVLVVVASWEERFPAGVERSLAAGGISNVVCLASERYAGETASARERVGKACSYTSISLTVCISDFEDQVSVHTLAAKVAHMGAITSASRVIVDISTAPRSLTWMLLGALRRTHATIVVRYYRALQYGDWQTTEEGEPKLIMNRSGIMYPDLPTCLVMLCGPEISRAEKLCYRFEPKKALILRDPRAAEFGPVKHLPQDYADVAEEHVFDNKLCTTKNMDLLSSLLFPYQGSHNIVAASLGPKLGSLILFKLSERNNHIALSYVTSGKHNFAATRGVGEMQDFAIDFETGAFGL